MQRDINHSKIIQISVRNICIYLHAVISTTLLVLVLHLY